VNIIQRIENEYGALNDTEKNYLLNNAKYFTEEDADNFLIAIAKEKKKGVKPSVKEFSDAMKKIGKKPPVYYWCVCLECGTEYAYGLPMCPKCYDEGFECRAYEVKHSDFKPPMKTVNYNKQYLHGDEGEFICYECRFKEMSYCEHFGNPEWQCRDYRECPCSSCCSKMKSGNAKIKTEEKERKPDYRIPLHKGANNDRKQ